MCVSPTRRRRAAALLLVAGGCLWVERGVAQEDPGVEIRTLLRRAERARNAGDLERAESDARRVLGLALEQVGAIDTALGRFGEAERAYVEACRMYPLSPRPCLGVASVSLRIGNYVVGKQWARRVLELDPLHHEARHALGSLYFMEGDFDRAADELRTAYALRPDQTRVAYTLGLVNLERGRLPEAQNLFDEVLEELGDSASLRVFFGRAYRETGHLDLAAEELQAALDLDAQCPGANYYLGLIYLQQRGTGAIPEAVPRFEAERRVNPRHELAGRFLELLGARAEGGDKGGAEVEGRADRPGETFSELLARAASETLILADDPVSDDERRALAALAETYRAAAADANRHLARIRAARRDHGAVGRQEPAARLLDTRSASVRALLALASAAQKEHDAEKARRYVSEARKLAPASPDVLSAVAEVSLAAGWVADAVFALRLLRLMEPDRPEYMYRLGQALIGAGDAPAAIESLARYREARPEDAGGELMLGVAKYAAGENDEAARYLRAALELQPLLPDAHFYLGQIAYRRGEDDEARARLEKALEQAGDHPKARVALAKVLSRQGSPHEALGELRRAVKLAPREVELHFQFARIYSQLGDRERAEQHFDLYARYKREQDARRDLGRRVSDKGPRG